MDEPNISIGHIFQTDPRFKDLALGAVEDAELQQRILYAAKHGRLVAISMTELLEERIGQKLPNLRGEVVRRYRRFLGWT